MSLIQSGPLSSPQTERGPDLSPSPNTPEVGAIISQNLMPAPTTLAHFSSYHHRKDRHEERETYQCYIGHVFALPEGHAQGYEPNH